MTSTLVGRFTVRVVLVAALMLGMVALARPAWAETFTVTNTNDSGEGSLRAALQAANVDPASADIIEFSSPVKGEIVLASALPNLSNVEIRGPGAKELTVRRSDAEGTPDFRIFTVGESRTVVISSLTISGGKVSGVGNIGGGGILSRPDSILTVKNSTVSGNSALDHGGGGIYSYRGQRVTVEGSTISYNVGSTNSNVGSYGGGGIAFFEVGNARIHNSTISSNLAGYGGGIHYALSGEIVFMNSTITMNTASQGGGIYNYYSPVVEGLSTIIANNNAAAPYNYDVAGGLGGSFNLVGSGSELGSLQDNGGPTETHLPLPGSPALDQGNSFGATTDQRGSLRPVDHPNVSNASGGDGSDIGAVEVDPPDTPASKLLADLKGQVTSLGLPAGINTSLQAKLNDALAAANAGDTATACTALSDFISEVQALSGKQRVGIAPADAQDLIAKATEIKAVLGC